MREAEVLLQQAQKAWEAGNRKDALRLYARAAEIGTGKVREEAICNQAFLTQSPQEKVRLYTQLSRTSAYACNMLGVLLERTGQGKGTPRDWFDRAANLQGGCAEAYYNLALLEEDVYDRLYYLDRAVSRFDHGPSRCLRDTIRSGLALEEARACLKEPARRDFRAQVARAQLRSEETPLPLYLGLDEVEAPALGAYLGTLRRTLPRSLVVSAGLQKDDTSDYLMTLILDRKNLGLETALERIDSLSSVHREGDTLLCIHTRDSYQSFRESLLGQLSL